MIDKELLGNDKNETTKIFINHHIITDTSKYNLH